MFLLVAVIFKYSIEGIAEPDIWWHMRDANYLWQFHSLPRLNTYTFAGAGSPWLNFQWLSEIPFLLAFKSMGLQGVLLVYFVVLVLIFTGVYYRCWSAGTDCKDAAIATLVAVCFGGVSIAPRTLLFGWLCMVALLLVLDHFQSKGKGLWLLPFLFALWINLHGSWVFGMVVLVLTILAGFIDGEWGLVVAHRWTPSQLKRILVILFVSLAALFINPFGYALVSYPSFLLFRQHEVMQNIEEWQPVDFRTWNGKLVLILISALLAAALFSRRRWKLRDVLLVGFALWAALSHVRFMFFAGLIIAPIFAPYLRLFPPYERELDKPWLNGLIIGAIIGAMIFFFPLAARLQEKIDADYPRTALAFMQRKHINGRVFNEYGWGGYIEWNMPELPIFIDGRADVFVYNGVFDDFLNVTSLNKPFSILDKYRIDYVLVRPKEPLTYLLNDSPEWHVAYSDNIAVLYERSSAIAGPAVSSKAD